MYLKVNRTYMCCLLGLDMIIMPHKFCELKLWIQNRTVSSIIFISWNLVKCCSQLYSIRYYHMTDETIKIFVEIFDRCLATTAIRCFKNIYQIFIYKRSESCKLKYLTMLPQFYYNVICHIFIYYLS